MSILGDSTLGADQPATAAMLLRDRRCTPMCLVAVDGEAVECACPCGGAFHAALSAVVVPGSVRRARPDPPDEPALFPVPEFPHASAV